MSASVQKASEMKKKNEDGSEVQETVTSGNSAEVELSENVDSSREFSSELNDSRWSIVTFEGVALRGLPYAEALKKIKSLDKQKVSGLCIVTDEAAARVSKKISHKQT